MTASRDQNQYVHLEYSHKGDEIISVRLLGGVLERYVDKIVHIV